jgi:hypothetical protein
MKKLFIVVTAMLLVLWSCQKTGNAPQPPPPPSKYTLSVTVEGGQFGSVNWTTQTVSQGGTASLIATPSDSKKRVAQVVVNNASWTPEDTITFSKVSADYSILIRFTDTLDIAGMQRIMQTASDSTWHDRAAYWKQTNGNYSYQLLGYYSPCQQEDYYNFTMGSDYTEHKDVGSCDGNPPSVYKAKYEFSYNGEALTVTSNDGTTSTVEVDTLLPDKFVYTFINFQGKGKDIRVVATPTNTPLFGLMAVKPKLPITKLPTGILAR